MDDPARNDFVLSMIMLKCIPLFVIKQRPELTDKRGGLRMSRVELNVKAPDFTLADFNGKSVSLSDYAGAKNVLVVFNRGFF